MRNGSMIEDGRKGVSARMALGLALLAILLAELALCISPEGFAGGPSDDQRYFDIALDWYLHGPQPGTTHWALRVPLIAAVTGAFHLLGPTISALLVVPRLFYALFVGVTGATIARTFGMRVFGLWLAFVIASPVLHEMATSCFPEMVELSLGAASVAAFLAARRASATQPRLLWMVAAGIALGLAVLTRETAGFVAIGYLWFGLRRPGMPRALYAAMAAAFLLPIAAHVGWLWWLTGDPLYRLHVDAHHILIPSDHLEGKVYTGGSPFLNFDLARRWVPAGPTRIHWALNPLLDFLIDPAFGFVLLGCALAALPWFSGHPRARIPRAATVLLWAIGIGSYVTVTWLFTLRPQPRYYLPVICAGQIAFALMIATRLARAELKRRAAVLTALVLIGGIVPILVTRDAGWQAKLLVPYMAAHPGGYTSTDEHVAGRAKTPALAMGLVPPRLGPDAPIGEYRVRLIKKSELRRRRPLTTDPRYRAVARLDQPLPWLIRQLFPDKHDALLIERRVR